MKMQESTKWHKSSFSIQVFLKASVFASQYCFWMHDSHHLSGLVPGVVMVVVASTTVPPTPSLMPSKTPCSIKYRPPATLPSSVPSIHQCLHDKPHLFKFPLLLNSQKVQESCHLLHLVALVLEMKKCLWRKEFLSERLLGCVLEWLLVWFGDFVIMNCDNEWIIIVNFILFRFILTIMLRSQRGWCQLGGSEV